MRRSGGVSTLDVVTVGKGEGPTSRKPELLQDTPDGVIDLGLVASAAIPSDIDLPLIINKTNSNETKTDSILKILKSSTNVPYILDSGATKSMQHVKENIINFKPTLPNEEPAAIDAGGVSHQVAGTGYIEVNGIYVPCDYIPTLKVNVISLVDIHKQANITVLYKDKLFINKDASTNVLEQIGKIADNTIFHTGNSSNAIKVHKFWDGKKIYYVGLHNKQDRLTPYQLHLSLGHPRDEIMVEICKSADVTITENDRKEIRNCLLCYITKATKSPHNHINSDKAKRPLYRVHLDTLQITKTLFFTFITDEYTKYVFYICSEDKLGLKKALINRFKNIQGRFYPVQIASITKDNAKEFPNDDEFADIGIDSEPITSYTPQLNGTAEGMNRIILTKARSFLNALPMNLYLRHSLAEHVVKHAIYVHNRIPNSRKIIPYCLMFGADKPKIKEIPIFGHDVIVLPQNSGDIVRHKLETPLTKGVYLGNNVETSNVHHVWINYHTPTEPMEVVPATNITFDGNYNFIQEAFNLLEDLNSNPKYRGSKDSGKRQSPRNQINIIGKTNKINTAKVLPRIKNKNIIIKRFVPNSRATLFKNVTPDIYPLNPKFYLSSNTLYDDSAPNPATYSRSEEFRENSNIVDTNVINEPGHLSPDEIFKECNKYIDTVISSFDDIPGNNNPYLIPELIKSDSDQQLEDMENTMTTHCLAMRTLNYFPNLKESSSNSRFKGGTIGKQCTIQNTETYEALKQFPNRSKSNINNRLRGGSIGKQYTSIRKLKTIFAFAPQARKKLINDPINGQSWKRAEQEEILKLKSMDTYEAISLSQVPFREQIIGTRFVHTKDEADKKRNGKFKARLVAQGFSQDLSKAERYSPVISPEAVKAFMVAAVQLKLQVNAMDVSSAYLHLKLPNPIYVRPPNDVEGIEKGEIWRLRKALYGLQNSGREWYLTIYNILTTTLKFRESKLARGIFLLNTQNGGKIHVALYVDDLLVAYKYEKDFLKFKQEISLEIKIKDLGPVKEFCGVEYIKTIDGYKLHQSKFLTELLIKYNITDSPTNKHRIPIYDYKRDNQSTDGTQASTGGNVNTGVESTDDIRLLNAESKRVYQELLGSLLWLSNTTRPDLSYSVSRMASYTESATKRDLKMLRNILYYLHKNKEFYIDLTRDKGSTTMSITAYSDASFANEKNRRSRTGFIIYANGTPIRWKSKMQSLVTTSTFESEYVALSHTTNEVIWFKGLFKELGIKANIPKIFEDNQGVISSSTGTGENNTYSKHVDIKLHHVRDRLMRREIELEYVRSAENVADTLTKPLSTDSFYDHYPKLQHLSYKSSSSTQFPSS